MDLRGRALLMTALALIAIPASAEPLLDVSPVASRAAEAEEIDGQFLELAAGLPVPTPSIEETQRAQKERLGQCDETDHAPPVAVVPVQGTRTWSVFQVNAGSWSGHESALYAVDGSTAYVASKRFADKPEFASSTAELIVSKTTDGGATWTTKVVDAKAPERGSFVDWTISMDGHGPDVAFVAYTVQTGSDVANTSLRIARTTDGGATWSKQTVHPSYAGRYNAMHVTDAQTAVVSFYAERSPYAGLMIADTTDGGETWRVQRAIEGADHAFDVSLPGSYSGITRTGSGRTLVSHYNLGSSNFAVHTDLNVARSDDLGAWSNDILAGPICRHTGLGSSIAASGDRALITYVDRIPDPEKPQLAEYVVKIARSTDGGGTWSLATLETSDSTGWDTSTHVTRDGRMVAVYHFRVGLHATVRVAESFDAGETWSFETFPEKETIWIEVSSDLTEDNHLWIGYRTRSEVFKVARLAFGP